MEIARKGTGWYEAGHYKEPSGGREGGGDGELYKEPGGRVEASVRWVRVVWAGRGGQRGMEVVSWRPEWGGAGVINLLLHS